MSVAENNVHLPSDAELEERFARLERAAHTSLEQSRERRNRERRFGALLARLRPRRPGA